jgi:branched-subunit amino acid aminotransferase/4-amino-4-deoxychorismate lyase
VVRGGALATPPLNTPVLPGVSRSVVLEIAKAEDIPNEERTLNINDVLDADEIFITNSSMQVVPVCRVEKKDIGAGKPGPMTARIRAAFQEVVKRECGAEPRP